MKTFTLIIGALALAGSAFNAFSETIPPAPTKYFDDRVGIISQNDAALMNEELANLEKSAPNHPQFVISILKYDTESSLEDYTNRIANAWKIGQKQTSNGLVLFWFPDVKKLRFETGYGNEAVLPDIRLKQILNNQIIPKFAQKQYAAGLESGISEINKQLVRADVIKINKTEDAGNPLGIFLVVICLGVFGYLAYRIVFKKKEEIKESRVYEGVPVFVPSRPDSLPLSSIRPSRKSVTRVTQKIAKSRRPVIAPVPVPIPMRKKVNNNDRYRDNRRRRQDDDNRDSTSTTYIPVPIPFNLGGSSRDNDDNSSFNIPGGGSSIEAGGGSFGGGGASASYS